MKGFANTLVDKLPTVTRKTAIAVEQQLVDSPDAYLRSTLSLMAHGNNDLYDFVTEAIERNAQTPRECMLSAGAASIIYSALLAETDSLPAVSPETINSVLVYLTRDGRSYMQNIMNGMRAQNHALFELFYSFQSVHKTNMHEAKLMALVATQTYAPLKSQAESNSLAKLLSI